MLIIITIIIDSGGCLVLNLLVQTLRSNGYSVSTGDVYGPSDVSCHIIETKNKKIVMVYPEVFGSRCNIKGALHVHWMLAPVGVHIKYEIISLSGWETDDLVFNYGPTHQKLAQTNIPIPASNVLLLANDPREGDVFDPSVTDLNGQSRSGLAYIIRKGFQYNENLKFLMENGTFPHYEISHLYGDGEDYLFDTSLYDPITRRPVFSNFLKYEYFLSYDPNCFLSLAAAMMGAISIVYPLPSIPKEEWMKAFPLNGYLVENNLPLEFPGIAYGWSEKELQYARDTKHLLRPLLLKVNAWGNDVSVSRFIRDCIHWHSGNRDNFEGGVMAGDFYNISMKNE